MRRIKFARVIEAQLELTRAELGLLIANSKAHYDGHCRSMSEVGGILYGMRNMLDLEEEGVARRFCTFRDVDSMTKCMEIGRTPEDGHLWFGLKRLLNEINSETVRCNPD